MWIAHTLEELRQARQALAGPVAVVPTMGALHAGHLSLVAQAKKRFEQVIVTIFVNPTQFLPHEDFTRYPRPIERDLAMCRDAGVTGVFNPSAEAMYPAQVPAMAMDVPALSAELEGAVRPGHFAGVCRVVAKLFHLTRPDAACFGQKDLQQLLIIQAMVDDLNLPVEIIACPTLREADGLAMSSRNVYLSPEQRQQALGLSQALREARQMVRVRGETDPSAVESAMAQIIAAHHMTVDYAVVRHGRTLARLDAIEPKVTHAVAALVAAKLGPVRLIDNAFL